ncbi:replicative helicase loader/inhibitor [Anaerotignum sp.]|uniref:replicative helicase loader/inhibitor n=1 Tax=Anaerotignum sp. TaxID=2039241 RepID=UPI0028A60094|nr:replicative helicase loader/inhibitor [Anaerotignum sp.]
MTREGIIGVLSILKTAYPNHFGKISKQDAENTINLWASMFAQEDGRMVSYAVKQLIATNVFPPTIAEVCGVLAEAKQGQGIDSAAAWGQVQHAIRRFGYTRGDEALASMHPVTAEVVRRLGWMDLCRSENVIADRAHFIKLFEGKQSKAREMAMIPLEVKEGLSQMPKSKALPQIGGDEAK